MLERDHLLIDPRSATAVEATSMAQSRAIRALPEGERLGDAAMQPASRCAWLAGPSLLVHEGEDASLLMTMRRVWRWSSRWTVRDADNRLVGNVHARVLLNARGQLVARLDTTHLVGHGRLIGVDDRELASFQFRPDGSLALLFAPMQENNPFTRMLLLGAALVLA